MNLKQTFFIVAVTLLSPVDGASFLLHDAVWKDDYEKALKLLSAGTDVNAQDLYNRTPLHVAAIRNHLKIVKLLIKYDADPNTKNCVGEAPLHIISRNNYSIKTATYKFQIAQLLIQNGADINTKNNDDKTPLDLATTREFKEKLIALAATKAKIDVVKKLWEMENPTFTHYLQWPPQEIIDDLIQLIDTEN